MIGFPRSGTTLLEQILGSHPFIEPLEEKGTVSAMLKAYLDMSREQQATLSSLTADQIAQLKATYFKEVQRHVEQTQGKRLVDKMPLNTAYVPLIWRVFPNAKFVFSIRHPCDVCLSCFMQNFALNEAMAAFLSLEGTAKTYALVMSEWQRYTNALPLDYYTLRYEDLITDVEGHARELFNFLDIPWAEVVLNHTEHARNKANIRTPSYHQVTQPIYQHAKYRWRQYEAFFEPLMPYLRSFIDLYGYASHEEK